MIALDLTALADLGVVTPADPPGTALAFYRRWGFVVLRDVLPEQLVAAMEDECVTAQRAVVAGTADPRHGSTKYLDDETKAERFANYVERVEELAPAIDAALATSALVELVGAILGADF